MAVTPNYGWPVPVATDYVKDGWEAISDLGNAIDTTVAGLGSGLNLINVTSFSAQSSVSFNNIFTSTYQNYKVVCNFASKSANSGTYIKFRASGTDTTSNYNYAIIFGRTNNTVFGAGAASTGFIDVVYSNGSTFPHSTNFDVYSPNEARGTVVTGDAWGGDVTTYYTQSIGGNQTDSTQFDGFSIFTGAGNMTGTIRVYGYENS